jgi:hypothetical protein
MWSDTARNMLVQTTAFLQGYPPSVQMSPQCVAAIDTRYRHIAPQQRTPELCQDPSTPGFVSCVFSEHP